MKKVKVGIIGYGVIGKRVADAVVLQNDMELVGVCDVVSDWRIKMALDFPRPEAPPVTIATLFFTRSIILNIC